jgi:hypothetical protein
MDIKDMLNKFFKSKDKPSEDYSTVKIVSNNSYCYSNIVWNSAENLIILISFSEDFFGEIIDLQDAIINSDNRLVSKIVYSSYDEKTDKKDDNGDNLWIIHKKYYMLIGGHPTSWQNIYTNINDLGNNILFKITDEIVNNCYAFDFETVIKDGILEDFKYNKTKPDYDIPKEIEDGSFKYTDPAVVLSRLPNGFTGRDILKFIMIYRSYINSYTNAYNELINIIYMDNTDFANSKFYNLYSSLFKNPTINKLKIALDPLYKQPDDDSIAGDVDDESLDEIFREHYERFSAIADDSIHYEDIDEKLADSEESENMREVDKI